MRAAAWLLTLGLLAVASDVAASDPPEPTAIGDRALPAGSVVRYREPNAWDMSRRYFSVAAAALLFQTFVIGVLVVEHRRRRRAELEVRRHLEDSRTHLVAMSHLNRRAAMGEVAAAITHELNQPIEAILHNAEAAEIMLESGSISLDELRQILADIRRIDTRAGDIIHRMRGLLRKHELEKRPVDVNEFVRDTVALVAPVACSHGVRVDLELMNDETLVSGDRVHLQQVLLNLLLNGLDAMASTPRERRRLLVQTRQEKTLMEISVNDAGQGIPADAVTRIFDPFYTTKRQGMGIGLSIARTIVEAHGGRIAARNNPKAGATVWFTLPSPGGGA